MAYQKKQYRNGTKRGGGTTERKNRPHRYATRSLKETQPGPSPTYLAATAARKLKV